MHTFISGVIVGSIVLQTAILAPTLFRTIDPASAGKLLRALFPKFFGMLSGLGLLQVGTLWLHDDPSWAHIGIGVLTISFPLICRRMIPAANRARDEGRKADFDRLHTLSVALTVAVLLANLAVPFLARPAAGERATLDMGLHGTDPCTVALRAPPAYLLEVHLVSGET